MSEILEKISKNIESIALDHGIEPPEEREKAGKSKNGKIHLQAYHQGGNIIVETQMTAAD